MVRTLGEWTFKGQFAEIHDQIEGYPILPMTFCILTPGVIEIFVKNTHRIVKNLIGTRTLQKTGFRTLKTTPSPPKTPIKMWGCSDFGNNFASWQLQTRMF